MSTYRNPKAMFVPLERVLDVTTGAAPPADPPPPWNAPSHVVCWPARDGTGAGRDTHPATYDVYTTIPTGHQDDLPTANSTPLVLPFTPIAVISGPIKKRWRTTSERNRAELSFSTIPTTL